MSDVIGTSSGPVISASDGPVLLPDTTAEPAFFGELDQLLGRIDARRASASSAGVVLEAGS